MRFSTMRRPTRSSCRVRAQTSLIADLIAMYDRPEQPNSKASRMTKIFPIRHSKASVIAETLKDVYRDLLSAE